MMHHNRKTGSFGIWMDFRKAMIFKLSPSVEFRKKISSEIEVLPKTTGGKGPSDPHFSRSIAANTQFDGHRNLLIKRYFDEIKRNLPNARDLLIVGPGVAKNRFKHFLELEQSDLFGEVKTDSYDYCTLPQLRKYFEQVL